MANIPSAVILSTSHQNPHTIVKGILDEDDLQEPELGPIGVDCWKWSLNNKYYTASVHLSVISQPESNLSYIMDHCEALLVYFDSSDENGLSVVDEMLHSLGDFEPEVQMLICDSCDNTSTGGVSRFDVQQWCIDQGWELIELNKSEKDDSDEETLEDDFPESVGFKRIRQALHAHTWSNLNLKESEGNLLGSLMSSVAQHDSMNYSQDISYHPLEDQDVLAGAELNSHEEENVIDPSCVQADMLGGLVDPATLEDCLNLASGCGNFDDLFCRFEQLKQTAAGLPTDQRKDYAEKVAVAFWKAMGGDDDEILDLDSEEDPFGF